MAVGQVLHLKIERLAYHSGHGVARSPEGIVVFVPFTCPEDEVEATVTEHHRTYVIARLTKVLRPSPWRRTPPCPVVGRCGGCQWQQVAYEEQVRQKDQLLREHLRGLKHHGEIPFRPFLPAPEEFRYRNRIQVHRHGKQVGFYAPGSHELIAIEDCWLAEPEIAQALVSVRDRSQNPKALAEERIEIARHCDGETTLSVAPGESEGRFAQVNKRQNEVLIELVRQAVRGRSFSTVVDLFCGSGNLTLPLAEEITNGNIHGVELSRPLIEQAKSLSAGHSARARLHWHAQTAASFLQTHSPSPDSLLVLDPPRPGCDKITRTQILRLKPRQILYVSCNPATLARDVEAWLKDGGYQVESVQGLDMFPQTAHVEVVLSLLRS